MNTRTRQKALRAIASSLLASDLSPNELMGVVASLQRDVTFQHDLAQLLEGVNSLAKKTPASRTIVAADTWLNDVKKLMTRHRISKANLLDVLNECWPKADHLKGLPSNTILEELAMNAPDSVKRDIVVKLAGNDLDDPYLKAILKS